jgi:hypothetical protein
MLGVALALVSGSAWAQQEQKVPQHKGLYLRFALGGGYASMGETDSGGDSVISGGAVDLDMNISGFVAPNVALGLDVSVMDLPGPSVRIEGMDLGSANNAQFHLITVGPALTFLSPDLNVYGGVSAGLAVASIDNTSNGMSARSQNGFGMSFLGGKEWWVSPHWGVGVAGHFFFMAIPDTSPMGASVTAKVLGGGLILSSSYSGG